MMKWTLHKAVARFERDWNYDASYMHDMIDASPRAAWLFSRVTALGQFRRDIPAGRRARVAVHPRHARARRRRR